MELNFPIKRRQTVPDSSCERENTEGVTMGIQNGPQLLLGLAKEHWP